MVETGTSSDDDRRSFTEWAVVTVIVVVPGGVDAGEWQVQAA